MIRRLYPLFVVVLASLASAPVIGHLLAIMLKPRDSASYWVAFWVGGAVGFIVLMVIAWQKVAFWAGCQSYYISKDGQLAASFDHVTALWRWQHPELIGAECHYFAPRSGWVEMEAHPISANPAVREICYEVTYETGGTAERAMLAAQKAMEATGTNHVDDFVRAIAYDFQEARKTELASISNPVRQAGEFRALADAYFAEAFQYTGITYKSAQLCT